MNVLRYNDSLAGLIKSEHRTIFLAGPTVRGNQPHLTSWRFEAIEEFKKQSFDGTLIVPEFVELTESDKGKYWIPRWEYSGLCQCDVIMFWVPRTKELIGLTTNHEHGYWLGRRPGKMVYGRPEDSYRNAYLDLMWELSDKHLICTTLEQTVKESIATAKAHFGFYRQQSGVPVESPYGAF